MSDYDNKLSEIVKNLIQKRREDDWWDFKECHHEDKASLLHDIICLANNRANRDAYLIFGVRDKTFDIIGVEQDPNRRNQQNIVDFLSSKNFAGQVRPRVEVHTVTLKEHEIDVFIIKNSTDVPYYLVQNYTDKKYISGRGKTVQAFHIYTRVMDNNTAIDKNADIKDIEYLWKKRLGLIQTPLEKIKMLLHQPDEWVEEDSHYYHKLFPQYTIEIKYEEYEDGTIKEGHRAFYHYLQDDTSTQYGKLKIYHYATQLYSCPITELDGHRMTAPCPDWGFIKYGEYNESDIMFKYYIKTTLNYILFRFLETKIGADNGGEAQIATRKHLEVILLFEDEIEMADFESYVLRHLKNFDELVSKQKIKNVYDNSGCVAKSEIKKISESYVLKSMYKEWKSKNGFIKE